MTLESLSQFGSSLLMCAGESAVRSIALALTAGLVLSNLRVKQSGLRLLSWTGVLYAAMLMPLLGLILPRSMSGCCLHSSKQSCRRR